MNKCGHDFTINKYGVVCCKHCACGTVEHIKELQQRIEMATKKLYYGDIYGLNEHKLKKNIDEAIQILRGENG